MPTHFYRDQKKKTRGISLNYYRNWTHHVSNPIKKDYHKLALEKRGKYKVKSPCIFYFKYYHRTKSCGDLGNWCCIQEKFFLDALVKGGFLDEDDCHNVVNSVYLYGGHDKLNPRVEIGILCEGNQSLKFGKYVMKFK